MTAVYIITGGAIGLVIAAVVGVFYTISVGGIEQGVGDPREYVVSGIVLAGIFIGCLVGWRLA